MAIFVLSAVCSRVEKREAAGFVIEWGMDDNRVYIFGKLPLHYEELAQFTYSVF